MACTLDQRNRIEAHQDEYQEIASHLEDLRTMCDPRERKTLIARYTECTKFLGRVCEVVSAREDALDKLLLFHNGTADLREELDQIQSELKTATITSDQLVKWQEESQDLKAKLKDCMKNGAGLDQVLQQAQLTGLDNSSSKQRTTVKGYLNRLEARVDQVISEITIKQEHFDEVDNIWKNFLDRKERLVTAVDDIEEKASADINLTKLTLDDLHELNKKNEKLKEELESKQYELSGLQSKGKQLTDADPSQAENVKDHLKLVDMSWEDAESAIDDTEEQLEKLISHLKDYEYIRDKNSKIIKNAEDLAEAAEAPRHFTIEEVKRHLDKLETLKEDLDEQQGAMDDMKKKGKILSSAINRIIISDASYVHTELEDIVDRYLDVQDKVEETIESLSKQLALWKELSGADDEMEEWMNTSITDLNASISSLEDSAALKSKLAAVQAEITGHQAVYESLRGKVSDLDKSRKELSVGEMDELAQVNDNMRNKLDKALSVYKQAHEKLDDFTTHKTMLSKYVDDLIEWLKHKEHSLKNLMRDKRPENLNKAREIHDKLSGERDNVESAKEHLNTLCRKYQTNELDAVQEKVGTLTTTYDDVYKLSVNVVDALEGHLDDEFHSAVKSFYAFFRAGKEILSDCSDTSADIPVLEGRLQKLQSFAAKVDDGQSKLNAAVEAGNHCIEHLPRSIESVKGQITNMKDDWLKFLAQLDDVKIQLQSSLSGLKSLEENRKDLAARLKEIEKKLREEDDLDEGLEEKIKRFERIEAITKELSSKSHQIEMLLQQAHELVEGDSSQSAGARKAHQLITHYHGIMKKCKERLRECEQIVADHRQYEESYHVADDWIQSAMTRLDTCLMMVAVSKSSDDVETGLNAAQETLQELTLEKQEGEVKLNVALGKGERAMAKTIMAGKDNMKKDLNELKNSYEEFIEKLSDCKTKLEQKLLDWTEYSQARDELSSWLSENEAVLSGSLAPAVDLKDKVAQFEKYKLILQDVESHKETVDVLNEKALNLDQDEIKDMLQQYNLVLSLAKERFNHLDSCVRRHESYYEAVQDFCGWINSAKEELNRWADLSGDKDVLQKKLNKILALKASRSHGRQKLDTATEIGEQVIENTAETGQIVIKTELASLKEEWRSWDRGMTESEIALQSKLNQLLDYEKSYGIEKTALEEALAKFKAKLDELESKHPQEGTDEITKPANAFKTKKLCQSLIQELEELQDSVDSLKARLNNLCRSYQSPEIDQLSKQVTASLQRYDNMKMKLAKLRTKCEKNLLEAFHTSARDFDQWLKGKKELVQRYGDVSGNKKAAQQKLEQIQVLLRSVDEGKTKLNILIGLGEELPNILRPESSENVRLQTKQCKEAWRNFLAMLQEKEQSLQSYVEQLTDFATSVTELTKWLRDVEGRFQAETGLRATIGLKKSQFNSLQAIAEDVTDPNYKFERLKRKAHKLGSSPELTQLNQLTAQYHTISKQVQDALKHSEQNLVDHQSYQTAFTEAQEWNHDFSHRLETYSNLTGGKEMLEQRLHKLDTLLGGKQEGEVKTNIARGHSDKILPTTAAKGQPTIRTQVMELSQSWQENVSKAEAIRDQLRKCISAWEKYEEAVKSAQNWLQNTDVTVKAEKIVHEGQTLSPEALCSDLDKCRSLYREIKNKGSMVENVQQCASNIATLTGDVSGTRVDLAEIREHYQELMNAVQALLNEAEILAESAKTYHQALHVFTDWFSGKPVELFRLSDTSCNKEMLMENIKALEALQEETPEGDDKLKQAVSTGKRSSPDKSINLQLQTLREEWSDYKKKLEEALTNAKTLVQETAKYERICNEFVDWITAMEQCPDAEIELTGNLVENRELLNRYKTYSNEISANQSKLDRLNKAAQQLVGSCGSTNGNVSMQVTQMMSRYQALIIRTKDKLRKFQDTIQLQSDLDNEAEEFDKWLQATDERFALYTQPDNIDAENAQDCSDKLDELLAEFESRKALLSSISDKNSKLCQLLDPIHTEGFRRQTAAQHEDFQELLAKIQTQRGNLRRTLRYYEDFQESLTSFKEWMVEMQRKINTKLEVQYELYEKKAQLARFLNYHEEIQKHNETIDMVVLKARRLPDNIRETREVELLNEDQKRLVKLCKQKVEELKSGVKVHQDYFEGMQAAEKWLLGKSSQIMAASSQDFPSELDVSQESATRFESQLKEFQAILEEINNFRNEVQSLSSMSKRLLNEYEDKAPLEGQVKKQFEQLQTTYMTVHNAATQLVDRLKGVVHRQQDFNVKLQQIRSWLTEKEAAVKVCMIRKPSSLEESQRIVKDLAFTAVELEEIQDFVEANVSEHPEEMEPIKLQLEEFQNMLDNKMQKANDIATDWLAVTDALSELQAWLTETENVLERVGDMPVEGVRELMLRNMPNCREIRNELENKRVLLDQLEERYKEILGDDDPMDPGFIEVQTQWEHLLSIAKKLCAAQEENTVATADFASYLQYVDGVVKDFKSDIDALFHNTADDTETKLIQAHEIVEKLEKSHEILDLLNEKMQTITPKMTVHDAETVEDKYRAVHQKWVDCEQKAQSRYNMLLNTVNELQHYCKQLEDTHQWLTAQKLKFEEPVPMTISIEELNAARQKHNMLCKELSHKKEEFGEISSCHQTLSLNLSSQEREKLQSDVEDLQKYFRQIQKLANEKTNDLNQAIGKRKDLWATAQQAIAWLEHLRESLCSQHCPPLSPDTVAKLIQDHRALFREIMRHKKTVDDVTTAGLLLIFEGKPEGIDKRGKLSGLGDHYAEVEELWKKKMDTLQDLLADRELFQADCDRCHRWLKEADIVTFPEVNLAAPLSDLESHIRKYQQITAESGGYQDLVQKIQSNAKRMRPELSEPDQDVSDSKIKSIEDQFNLVCAAAVEKEERLVEMMAARKEYTEELEVFEDYLSKGQALIQELDDLPTGYTSERARELLAKAEGTQDTLSTKKPRLDSIERMRDSLKNSGQPWQPEELLKATAIFHRLMQQSMQRIERFKDMVTNREDFEYRSRRLAEDLAEHERVIKAGSPSRTEHRLAECQQTAAELTSAQIELRSISGLAEQLCGDMAPLDRAVIREKVENLRKTLHGLQADIGDRQRDLERRLMSRRDFQGELEYGIVWLNEIQAAIECDKPLKLDTQNVQEEMKKLQLIQEEVQSRLRMLIGLGELDVEKYRDEGEEPPRSVNQKLREVHELKESLTTAILAKQNRLEDAFAARQKYEDCLRKVQSQLGSASAELQLLNGDNSPRHAKRLLIEHQALFTTEDEVLHNIEELSLVAQNLEQSPALSNTARKSLHETIGSARGRADNLLDMAHEIRDTLEKSAVSWEGFDEEVEKVQAKVQRADTHLVAARRSMPNSVHEARVKVENFKPVLHEISQLDNEVQALQKVSESISSGSFVGRMSVNRCISGVKDRIERLQARSRDVEQLFQNQLREWEDYHREISSVKSSLEQIESRMPIKQIEKCTALDLDTQKSLLSSLSKDLHATSRRMSAVQETSQSISRDLDTARSTIIDREVEDVDSKLQSLKEEAEDKASRVRQEEAYRESIQEELQDLLQWLKDAKNSAERSTDLTPSPAQVQDRIDSINHLKDQLCKKKEYFESWTENEQQKYLDKYTILPPEISSVVVKIKVAFDDIEAELDGKEKDLDAAKSLREEYQKELLDISSVLSDAERKLTADVKDHGTAESEHRALKSQLDDAYVRLVNLDALAGEISEQTTYESSKISINAAISALNEQYARVSSLANVRSKRFSTAITYQEEVDETHAFLKTWQAKAEKLLAGRVTIRDLSDAKLQLRDNKALRRELNQLHKDIDQMRERIPQIGTAVETPSADEDSFEYSLSGTLPTSSFFSKKIDQMTTECQDLECKIMEREDILSSAIAAAEEMEKETKAINEGVENMRRRYPNLSLNLPPRDQLSSKKGLLRKLQNWRKKLHDMKNENPFVPSPVSTPRNDSDLSVVPKLSLDQLHEIPALKLAEKTEHVIDDLELSLSSDILALESLLEDSEPYDEEISRVSALLSDARHRLDNLPMAGINDLNERKELLEEIEGYEKELKRLKNLKKSLETVPPQPQHRIKNENSTTAPISEMIEAVCVRREEQETPYQKEIFNSLQDYENSPKSSPRSRSPKHLSHLSKFLSKEMGSTRSMSESSSDSSSLDADVLSPLSSPGKSTFESEIPRLPLPIDASSPYGGDSDVTEETLPEESDALSQRVQELLLSSVPREEAQSLIHDITKKLDEYQERLDEIHTTRSLEGQFEDNQNLIDDMNRLQSKLESLERWTSTLAHDYAGKDTLHTTMKVLCDRWDTMRMQAHSKQSVIEIKMLEDEQYCRMVEAYKAELEQVMDWMEDAKKLQDSMTSVANSSNPPPPGSLSEDLAFLQKHIKECEKTATEVERKLRLISELCDKTLSLSRGDRENEKLLGRIDSVKDELQSLQQDIKEKGKRYQDTLCAKQDETIEMYEERVAKMQDWLNEAKALDPEAGIDLDEFKSELQRHQDLLERVANLGRILSLSSHPASPTPEENKKNWNDLVKYLEAKASRTKRSLKSLPPPPTQRASMCFTDLDGKQAVTDIRERLQDLQDCWKEMKNEPLDSKDALQKLQRQTHLALQAVSSWMDGAEARLCRRGSFEEEQQVQDALHSEMESVHGQMGQLRNVKDNISSAALAPEFAESIKSALQSLSHRLKVLEDEAQQREVELAEKDMEQTDFQADVAFLSAEVGDLYDDICALRVSNDDFDVDELREFEKLVEERKERLRHAEEKAAKMNYPPWGVCDSEFQQLKSDVEELSAALDDQKQAFDELNHDKALFAQLLHDYSEVLITAQEKLKLPRIIVRDLLELNAHNEKFKEFFAELSNHRSLCDETESRLHQPIRKRHELTLNEMKAKHSTLENRAVSKQQQLGTASKNWNNVNGKLPGLVHQILSLDKELDGVESDEENHRTVQEGLEKLRGIQKRVESLDKELEKVVDDCDSISNCIRCDRLKSEVNTATEKMILLKSKIEQELMRFQTLEELLPRFSELSTDITEWFVENFQNPVSIVAEVETFEPEEYEMNEKCAEFDNIVKEFIDIKTLVDELKKVSGKLDLAKKVGNDELRENVANIEDNAEKMDESLPELHERLYQAKFSNLSSLETLTELTTWIKRTNERLDDLKRKSHNLIGSQELKKQLASYKAFQLDFNARQSTVDRLNASAKAKCLGRTQEAEIAGKLDYLNMEWDILKARIDNCKTQLDTELREWERHENAISEIQKWINSHLQIYQKHKQPGSKSEIQRGLLDIQSLEPLIKKKYSEIRELEREYKRLVASKNVKFRADSPEPGLGSSSLAELNQTWAVLEHEVNQRKLSFKRVLDQWNRFTATQTSIVKELEGAEHTFIKCSSPCSSLDSVASQVSRLQGLQIELDRHDSLQELLQVDATSLIAICNQATADEIREKVTSFNERYNEISSKVERLLTKLQETYEIWQQYETFYLQTENRLLTVRLQSDKVLSAIMENPHQCEMKAEELLKVCSELEKSTTELSSFPERLSNTSSSVSMQPLFTQNARLEKSLKSTEHYINQLLEKVMKEKVKVQEFKQKLKFIESWLVEATAVLCCDDSSIGPTSVQNRMEELRIQLYAFKSYAPALDTLNRLGYELPVSESLVVKLQDINANWIETSKKTAQKFQQLQSIHLEHLNFMEKCESWMLFITQMEASLTCDVASSHSGLLEQSRTQELFSVEMASRQVLLRSIISDGERLLENGTKDERTEFKHKLDELEIQWNSVMDRMRQRKHSIDEGITIWTVYMQNKNRFVKWMERTNESMQSLESEMEVRLSMQGVRSDLDKLSELEKSAALNEDTCSRTLEAGKDVLPLTGDDEFRGELAALHNEWLDLNKSIQRKKRDLQKALSNWTSCESKTGEMMDWLKDTKKMLALSLLTDQDEIHAAMIKCRDREIMFDMTGDKLRSLDSHIDGLAKDFCRGDVALLRQRVELLRSQWEELRDQTQQRRCLIETKLSEWDDFDEKYRGLCEWLNEMEVKISQAVDLPLEGVMDQLEKQYREELSYAEDRKAEIHTLGDKLLGECYEGRSRDVGNKLAKLNERWKNLENMNKSRSKKLRETLEAVNQLEQSMCDLRSWLKDVEDGLTEPVIHRSCEDSEIARRLTEQQTLQKDIEKHSSGVASVLELCEVLLHDVDACSNQSEKTSIEKASESLDRRWRNICSLSVERKLKIEETQRLWKKFREDYSRFSDWLRSAELVVTYPNSQMVPHKVAKEELKKYETFQRQVQDSLTHLELINKQYRKLARENRTDATNQLKVMIHDGNSRWDAISHRVASILRRLKLAISRREDFESQRQELVVWLTEIDLRLTNVEHLSQQGNHEKLAEIRTFQTAVETRIPQIIDLHQKGQRVLEASEAQECVVIEEELTDLQRYCREVLSRLEKYHKKLINVMNQPPYHEASLFDDTELSKLGWWEKHDSGESRPSTPDDILQSSIKSEPALKTHIKRSRDPSGSHSGRATPESLEWDLYDISHSELSTKDNGVLTDDASIPEISPLEMDDEVTVLQVSRESNLSSLQNASGSSQRSFEAPILEETPIKKPRMSGNDRKSQFTKDLVETLAWCEATEKVTDQEMSRSGSKFEKSVEELEREVREIKDLESSIEEKRAVVLSINVTSSSYADGAEKQRLEKLNSDWESLQQKSTDWSKSLQESLAHSQDFQNTLTGISTWVDEQNSRRGDVTAIQQNANQDSTRKLDELKKGYSSLEQMKDNTLDAISKVSTMQGICSHLTSSGDSRSNGVRAVSSKVQSTNGRLKALLDAVRSDLRDMERRVKAARRKVREEKVSGSDSSEDSCSSEESMRFKMLERKVDASELHSSGRANVSDNMDATGATVKQNDVTKESNSVKLTQKSLLNKETNLTKTASRRRRSNVKVQKRVVAGEKTSYVLSKSLRPVNAEPVAAVLPSNGRATPLCRRVFLAALPFYILFALIFLLWWIFGAVSDDGLGCLRQNNYAYSFTPMLSYTNGPPPV